MKRLFLLFMLTSITIIKGTGEPEDGEDQRKHIIKQLEEKHHFKLNKDIKKRLIYKSTEAGFNYELRLYFSN